MPSPKIAKGVARQVCRLIKSHFPNWNATNSYLEEIVDKGGKILVTLDKKKKKVLAYGILDREGDLFKLELVGVVRGERGQGLGKDIVHRAITHVRRSGGYLSTYASIYNTTSVNMLIKCGLLVEYINTRWIFFKAE